MRALVLAIALAGCASGEHLEDSPAAAPIAVIQAERDFAADAAARGWTAAFRTWAAPEAITLSPDPVNAQQNLAQIPGDGAKTLDWRPAFAGVSRSGELGFTTGPFQIRGREGIVGHYFTVWRQEADGNWKWIFDGGTDVADPGPIVAADADIPTSEMSPIVRSSARQAIADVTQIETQIATGNALPADALTRSLDANAHVDRGGAPAAIGRDAAAALIANDGPVAFTSLRREGSEFGDMVFSLGEVRDQHEGAARLRYYARIWQKRPEGWRIVFDEIIPRRN